MDAFSFGDALFIGISAVLILITLITVVNYITDRDQAQLDITVLIGCLTLSFLLSNTLVWTHAPWVSTPATAIGFMLPFLKLRLLDHFRPVPRLLQWAALFGAAVTCAAVLAWSPHGKIEIAEAPWYLIAAVVPYYGLVEGFAIAGFLKAAHSVRGVTYWRLVLIVSGSLLFLATFLSEFSIKQLGFTATGVGAYRLLMTLSVLAYYVGFVPPGWFRRIVQFSELYGFLRVGFGHSHSQRAGEALANLTAAAERAVGAHKAVVALWDDAIKQLALWPPGQNPPFTGTLPLSNGAVSRAWHERRPVIVRRSLSENPDQVQLATAADAGAFFAVPIATDNLLLGVLLVFFRRAPVFADDDVALLSLMTEHAARFEELERVNRSKSEFLTRVSHDLRTPLTVLLFHIEALRRGIEPDPKRALRIMDEKAAQLKDLVNDLFELARMDTPQQPWVMQTVNLAELVRRSVINNLTLIEQAGIEVEAEVPDEPLWVHASAEKIERVMDNLLANAWKYGRAGRWLKVRAAVRDGRIRIEVTDRGPGIPPAERGRIFDQFYQAEGAQNQGGSGLGLAIAREIILRHGGDIGVESSEPQGASFWFELPGSKEP